jgi:hypothetical protein
MFRAPALRTIAANRSGLIAAGDAKLTVKHELRR